MQAICQMVTFEGLPHPPECGTVNKYPTALLTLSKRTTLKPTLTHSNKKLSVSLHCTGNNKAQHRVNR